MGKTQSGDDMSMESVDVLMAIWGYKKEEDDEIPDHLQ